MCRSRAEGGQRCAAHTRPVFERTALTDPAWDEAAAQYASTPEGRTRLTERFFAARYNHNYDLEARLLRALHRGADIRDANADAAEAIRNADLTAWEPAAIDGELARLHGEAAALRARRDSDYQFLSREVARNILGRNGFRATATRAEVEDAIQDTLSMPASERNIRERQLIDQHDHIESLNTQIADLDRQMRPYNKEFARRGGWSRAFLVTNGNGHVHRSMDCSTCRPTTSYYWVTEMSAKPEAEIVEAAGERACTTCYPSAPVEVRNRPSRIFSPEERAQQQARTTRASAAEQRQADRIAKALTPDGSEYRVECTRNGYPQRERFKTERAATTWMVSNMADYRGWRSGQQMDESMQRAHDEIIEAIANKHGKSTDEVRVEIEKKVAAKVRRDSRT